MTKLLGKEKLKQFLQQDAKRLGFSDIKITSADKNALLQDRLTEFVANDYHGDMTWMEETIERRSAPTSLWDQAKSVIVLSMNYSPDSGALDNLTSSDIANISVYARHRDYHDVMKGRLKEMAGRFAAKSGADVKVFVDTAPVMEKPLAQQAGLGWQGKHTNLVSRTQGSWFFLASIFTNIELETDESETDHCGSCSACLSACPTDAFPTPFKIDARRCISYLTIEHKGPIDVELRAKMGNRIYGCDDCLAACPWNKYAKAASEIKLQARDDLRAPKLEDFLTFDDATFRQFFSGSPVKRIGRDRFMRNILIAAGNSGALALIPYCKTHLVDPNPIVRGAAIWALSQLAQIEDLAALKNHTEQDLDVIAEWDLALTIKQEQLN